MLSYRKQALLKWRRLEKRGKRDVPVSGPESLRWPQRFISLGQIRSLRSIGADTTKSNPLQRFFLLNIVP